MKKNLWSMGVVIWFAAWSAGGVELDAPTMALYSTTNAVQVNMNGAWV